MHKLRTEIANLKEAIKKETKKKLKYKQRLKRIASKKQNKKATPVKKVEEMIGDQKVTPTVKRNLIFGEVMRTQLMENYKKINTNYQKNYLGNMFLATEYQNLTRQRSLLALHLAM